MSFSVGDPSSCTNYTDFITERNHLSWKLDFDKNEICGNILLSLKRLKPAKEILLDAKHLHIVSVQKNGVDLPWTYEENSILKIVVNIKDERFDILITYKTTPECTAIQWLTPSMTKGKMHPYMFSQCQAIHGRSLMPCQDTPAVKSSYKADVTVSSGLNVLMSARKSDDIRRNPDGTSTHFFEQPVPVPSYLLAIVAGNIAQRQLGPRTHVWTEPEMLEDAAKEFAETDTLLESAESICGPYIWGVYDMLVLPPSFPYGGMENPCLTFLTPTLLRWSTRTNLPLHQAEKFVMSVTKMGEGRPAKKLAKEISVGGQRRTSIRLFPAGAALGLAGVAFKKKTKKCRREVIVKGPSPQTLESECALKHPYLWK